jgi:hypothetical protein
MDMQSLNLNQKNDHPDEAISWFSFPAGKRQVRPPS